MSPRPPATDMGLRVKGCVTRSLSFVLSSFSIPIDITAQDGMQLDFRIPNKNNENKSSCDIAEIPPES
jgi:hypothetical protein